MLEDSRIGHGEPWRLLFSALPHVDIIHLAFNVYWLWVFGTIIEPVFGSLRTAALFAALAIPSSAAEYALLDGGVGLSGVGYGLFGFLLVVSRRDARFAGAIDARTTQVFIAWFFICLILTYTGTMSIGNVAHAVGFGMGLLLASVASATGARKIAFSCAACGALVVTLLAATVARRWINVSPHRGADEAQLGYKSLIAQDYQQARMWLEQAVTENPNEASYWYNLGVAQQELVQYDQAAYAYRRALALNPSMACREALVSIDVDKAIDETEHGRFDEAIRLCQEAVSLDPNSSHAWYNLGRALFMLGRQSEACAAVRKAAALNPADAVMRDAAQTICDATPTTQPNDI